MVPHQHLKTPEKGKGHKEDQVFVKWIPISEALKNEFWARVGIHQRRPIRGAAPDHMKRENETPSEKISLTRNSIEALPDAAFSG